MTYGCNHTESRPKLPTGDTTIVPDVVEDLAEADDADVVERLLEENEHKEKEDEYEVIGCDAILDIYYFYESSSYQIIQLGEHEHSPTNMPQILFGAIPGIGVTYRE